VLNRSQELELTVLLTVVSGKDAVRENLSALIPQLDFEKSEVIVPYDKFSSDIAELKVDFPQVFFHYIKDLGLAASPDVSAHAHRLYDRRRAVGLKLSRGRLIAMLEDHGRAADDWVENIEAAHLQDYSVIGGAIRNDVDKPLNWALYYCDFGRYAPPFEPREVSYVSDINLAYKRADLMAVEDIWKDAFHETAVHGALLARGKKLFRDDRPVVHQRRNGLELIPVLRERISWGRIFAETRASEFTFWKRCAFAAGSIFLPPLMLTRVFSHMRRQGQSVGRMLKITPVLTLILIAWAFGEFLGYVCGEPSASMIVSQPARSGVSS